MRYIRSARKFALNNVGLLLILSVASALLSQYFGATTLSYLLAAFAIFIFMPPCFAVPFIVAVIVVRLLSPSFFIVLDKLEFKDNMTLLKTPSASVIVDNILSDKIKNGSLIIANFKEDASAKRFYSKRYLPNSTLRVFELPLISRMIDYRNDKSGELFYRSAGKIKVSQALVFGDRRFITNDIKDQYIITGLAHLLSMSGMHVGVIVAIFMTMLFFLHTKLRFIFVIFGLMLLIVFGGFSVTVLRSSLFAAIMMSAYIFDYMVDRKRFIIFLASVFILFSASSVADISFLLSFGAVFGIFYLLDKEYNKILSLFLIGVAATLYTAPISLYVFNTTNHLSILSTVILTPVIYMQMFVTLLTLIFTPICLPALTLIESFSNFLVYKVYDLTYFAFILKVIPLWLLIVSIVFTTVALLTRYKYISVLSLLIIFYPSEAPPKYIFPNFEGSTKGYLSYSDNYSEIYFSGSLSHFKYKMLPAIARYGEKRFNYGEIRIFDGENFYLKLDERGKEFKTLCLNEKREDCKLVYVTRSNSISKKKHNPEALYIVYKNKFQSDNIYEISKFGEITIDHKGELHYDKSVPE